MTLYKSSKWKGTYGTLPVNGTKLFHLETIKAFETRISSVSFAKDSIKLISPSPSRNETHIE